MMKSRRQNLQKPRQLATDRRVGSVGLEHPAVAARRPVRLGVENEVVAFAALGEVFLSVVDDVVETISRMVSSFAPLSTPVVSAP